MAMLPWTAVRRPRPDPSLVVRGNYRPLTLPEVAALLPDHIHQSEQCPHRCGKTWESLRIHLARVRQNVSPHLHYLDIWQLRQWLGQPIVVSHRMDVVPCSWMREGLGLLEKLDPGDLLMLLIPQRIVRQTGFDRKGLKVWVRIMFLTEPVSSDDWANFLDPYCTPPDEDEDERPWVEGWCAVGRDGLVQWGGVMLVWAELVKETRLP